MIDPAKQAFLTELFDAAVLAADAKAVEDYMNWFEATQMTQWSDGFDRYFDVVRKLEASRPKRLNPISRALDEVERELE